MKFNKKQCDLTTLRQRDLNIEYPQEHTSPKITEVGMVLEGVSLDTKFSVSKLY